MRCKSWYACGSIANCAACDMRYCQVCGEIHPYNKPCDYLRLKKVERELWDRLQKVQKSLTKAKSLKKKNALHHRKKGSTPCNYWG